MTIAEYTQSLTSKLEELEQNFFPLLLAAETYKADVEVRIWDEHKNSEGVNLLTASPYSTKPIYINPENLPRLAGTFVGKRTGTRVKPSKKALNVGAKREVIKSAYFSEGYGQMKSEIGRPPVELFGFMRSSFAASSITLSGSKLKVKWGAISEETIEQISGKAEGLQKKYGQIFYPTEQELKTMGEVIAFETAQFLNA